MDNVSWYETRWKGKLVGYVLTLSSLGGFGATGAYAIGVWRPPQLVRLLERLPLRPQAMFWSCLGASTLAFLIGWRLRAKLYLNDPNARATYRSQFGQADFLEFERRFGWPAMLKFLSTDEIAQKLRTEMTSMTFAQIWARYGDRSLHEVVERHVLPPTYFGSRFEQDMRDGGLSGAAVLRELSKYSLWLVRHGCASRDSIQKRIREDARVKELSFGEFCDAGGFALFRGEFIPGEHLRTLFMRDMAAGRWTWAELATRYADVLRALIDGDIVRAAEVRSLFLVERDRLTLVEFMTLYGEWPLPKHANALLPDADWTLIRSMWDELKQYEAKQQRKQKELDDRIARELSSARSQRDAQVDMAKRNATSAAAAAAATSGSGSSNESAALAEAVYKTREADLKKQQQDGRAAIEKKIKKKRETVNSRWQQHCSARSAAAAAAAAPGS